MHKIRVVIIAVGVCLVMVAVFAAKFLKDNSFSRGQTSLKEARELSLILGALAVPLPSVSSTSNREALSERIKRRQDAIQKLRANASNLLPSLMQEVRAVGMVEVTNRSAAASRTAQLAVAFEVLGDDARPLLPQLKDEFRAGRSIGPCVSAFQHIGGTDCGLLIVSGLTNSDQLIRNGAMSVLSSFTTNREVAQAAVHPLLERLKDSSGFSRALAASVLGSLRHDFDVIIPSLLQVAKNDPDFVIRASAAKAIGRFGTNAAMVKSDLEGIAATDHEATVRRIASTAIRALSGEISPAEIQ